MNPDDNEVITALREEHSNFWAKGIVHKRLVDLRELLGASADAIERLSKELYAANERASALRLALRTRHSKELPNELFRTSPLGEWSWNPILQPLVDYLTQRPTAPHSAPAAPRAPKYDASDIALLAAAASTGAPGAITLAAQITGQQPCEKCGYVAHSCKCHPQPEQPASHAPDPSEPVAFVKKLLSDPVSVPGAPLTFDVPKRKPSEPTPSPVPSVVGAGGDAMKCERCGAPIASLFAAFDHVCDKASPAFVKHDDPARIADTIAGLYGVSLGSAYRWMADALNANAHWVVRERKDNEPPAWKPEVVGFVSEHGVLSPRPIPGIAAAPVCVVPDHVRPTYPVRPLQLQDFRTWVWTRTGMLLTEQGDFVHVRDLRAQMPLYAEVPNGAAIV
jgi:hypothetical protein